jgi:hypothetical protein
MPACSEADTDGLDNDSNGKVPQYAPDKKDLSVSQMMHLSLFFMEIMLCCVTVKETIQESQWQNHPYCQVSQTNTW